MLTKSEMQALLGGSASHAMSGDSDCNFFCSDDNDCNVKCTVCEDISNWGPYKACTYGTASGSGESGSGSWPDNGSDY